jgi:hypothetical protein
VKIDGTFTLTAAVNPARRTIIGTVVPFGEEGRPGLSGSGIRLIVEAGGLTWDPEQLPVLRSTHHTEPIGRAVTLDTGPDGIIGTFKVAATRAGDDALVLAAEGLQAGLSLEAEAPDDLTASDDGVYRLTASNPARLTAAALVESPAFASARVATVAAQETPMSDQISGAEVPDDVLSGVVSNLTDAIGQLSSALGQSADPTTAPSDPAVAASKVIPTLTAATVVKREAFPYGHAGAEGRSFFADLVQSPRDSLAAARVEKAESMWRQVAAADEAAVKTDVTIPNVYDTSTSASQQITFPRDIADSIPKNPVSSARPILLPQVQGVTADGGSGQVVSAHVENTNPAAGEIDIDYITVTPALYSGKFDISREALDAADPSMDSLLLGFLKESYNAVTEAAAVTALTGTSGIDTGSSTTDADAQVEARNMEKTLRQEMAAFKARRGLGPDVMWAAPGQYAALVGYDASDGRPILPYLAPQNTSGQVGAMDQYGQWNLGILGVPLINATYMTATKVLIARKSDCISYESPLLQFRWDEVAGPAKIRFVAAGYYVAACVRPEGLSLVTQA